MGDLRARRGQDISETMAPSWSPVVDIRSFPRDDEEFRADVVAAIVAGRGQLDLVLLLLDEVQAELRAQYPLVTIHAQSTLAVFPGSHPVIYAYRDGRVIAVAV